MSLLQEALKRKERDETAQSQPAPDGAEKVPVNPESVKLSAAPPAVDSKQTGISSDSPSQSMPVSFPPQTDQSQVIRRRASLLWVMVAVIAISIVIILTAGTGYVVYRFLPPLKLKISPPPAHAVKTDAIAPGSTNKAAATQQTAGAKPVYQSVAPDVKDTEEDSTAAAARPQTTAVTQGTEIDVLQQQPAGDTGYEPPATKPAPPRIKKPATPPEAVRWPALKLSGILHGSSGRAESTALINGQMIRAGQAIENVTVLEIQSGGVILKYGAEERFLRVGATSY